MSTVIKLTKCKLNTYVTCRKATVQHSTTLKQQHKSHFGSVTMLPRLSSAVSRGRMSISGTLTFRCLCIASISLKYNQDATFSQSIYFYKLLYMFQVVPPPIIRSTKLYIQHQVLSN